MKVLGYLGIAAVAYVGVVVAFEAYLGLFQPRLGATDVKEWDATVVITTVGDDGKTQDRMVVPMQSDGHLYVSANHWPRSWYKRALANPVVRVTKDGETKDYRAVAVPSPGEENDRLLREHPHPAWFRFLTGYPPRSFMRLEPR